MPLPSLQRRWTFAVTLLASLTAFVANATEPPGHAAPHYLIRGSLDEVPSSATLAPHLTAAASGMSVSRDGYMLAAHLVEVPLVCAGDEIFANGFD